MIKIDSPADIIILDEESDKRYTFEKVLGQGAYGVVFSAFDKKAKKYVAIKKVDDIFDTIIESKMMLREIKILQNMKHENVSGLIDVKIPIKQSYLKFNSVFIVLDLMDTDLDQIIYSDQHLSIEHRRYFMYQMFRGIKYIHSANILHRDLKPSNILVNYNCNLKICDFGLARIQNGNYKGNNIIHKNSDCIEDNSLSEYVTTRWYRAPEILLSLGRYGPELDIWSLGCIFAELILRNPLFPGKSALNQLAIINETIGSPTDHDLRNITNVKIKKYLNSLPQHPMVNWKELLKGACNDEIDLIKKMLTWDPSHRITAAEALKHPFFKQFHDPIDEPTACPMKECEFERKNISLHEMRKNLWNEIQLFNNEPALYSSIKSKSLSNGFSFPSDSLISSTKHRYSTG